MAGSDEEIAELLDDLRERLGAIEKDSADGSEPDPEALNELEESVAALEEFVGEASLDELLAGAGFESLPDDAEPADLPAVLAEADSGEILTLRRILEVAELGREWDDLATADVTARLDRTFDLEDGRASDEDGDERRDLGTLVKDVLAGDEGEEAAEEQAAEEEGTGESETAAEKEATDDEETADEAESDSLESMLESIRETLDAFGDESADAESESGEETDEESDADGNGEEDSDADEESAESSTDERPPDRGRYSTVPGSNRRDMNAVARFSTMKARK